MSTLHQLAVTVPVLLAVIVPIFAKIVRDDLADARAKGRTIHPLFRKD